MPAGRGGGLERRGAPSRRALLAGSVLCVIGAAATIVLATPRGEAGAEDATRPPDPLQTALDAVPVGGTLSITEAVERSSPLVVERAVTIRFSGAGAIRMSADQDALLVRASGVHVVAPEISGAGVSGGRRSNAITVRGTRSTPLTDVRISGGHLRDVPRDGVRAEYCDRVVVERVSVARVGYAGVLLLGVTDSVVRDNVVSDVRQRADEVNSYGITVTRDATANTSVTRRSSGVRILRNRVSGVPAWEGIDTHAGDRIEVRDNVVSGCRVGIAAVPSKSATDRRTTDVAPTRIVIAGNRVTTSSVLAAGSGIVVSGSGTTVGSTRPRATGSVTGNTITGAGGTAAAGVLVKLTRGFVVADNTIRSSVDDAIAIVHSNSALTVRANQITGVSGDSVGVDVRSGGNDGTITGNRIDRTDPRVRVGLRFGDPINRFVVRGNAFGEATVRESVGGAHIIR